jgi:dGTPase
VPPGGGGNVGACGGGNVGGTAVWVSGVVDGLVPVDDCALGGAETCESCVVESGRFTQPPSAAAMTNAAENAKRPARAVREAMAETVPVGELAAHAPVARATATADDTMGSMQPHDLNDRPAGDPGPVYAVDPQLVEAHRALDEMALSAEVRETVNARGGRRGGLVQAHGDSHGWVSPPGELRILDREEREALEESRLAPGATRARGAGNRSAEEEPDLVRTCFEKDGDRIRYATSFRRLAGKCQVFVAPRNDHLRNRLTHALETAQVAVSVARSVGLNVALVEAIALGHDCGHGPTGHASEESLSIYLPEGYDHAPYGADVTLAGLNLTSEVLDGVRNHSWKRPAPRTPEGELVSVCDRIAYVCHDFSDATIAGIVAEADLPALVREHAGVRHSDQVGYFINALVGSIGTHGYVGLDEEASAVLDAFRTMNFERIYLRPASRQQAERSIVLLRALAEHYIDMPGQIPDVAAGRIEHPGAGTEAAARLVVDYVSGMTDRYAISLGIELFGFRDDQLPRGV